RRRNSYYYLRDGGAGGIGVISDQSVAVCRKINFADPEELLPNDHDVTGRSEANSKRVRHPNVSIPRHRPWGAIGSWISGNCRIVRHRLLADQRADGGAVRADHADAVVVHIGDVHGELDPENETGG